MNRLLHIGKAIAVASLLLATFGLKAQIYPVIIDENFNAAYTAGTGLPTGWTDSNLSRKFYPGPPATTVVRDNSHQAGGWAIGPSGPATTNLHGHDNITPFDATDGFIYSRADSAVEHDLFG